MTDRPIIFSGPMVRALLEGRKTMTRRLASQSPKCRVCKGTGYRGEKIGENLCGTCCGDGTVWGYSPWRKVKPGDRLWVRETSRQAYPQGPGHGFIYKADAAASLGMDEFSDRHRWRPSIHMPRMVSRLTLTVTATKIERLQEMTAADAIAEGVEQESADPPFYYVPGIWPHSLTAVGIEEPGRLPHAVRSFAKLWAHLHGAESWDANPEVVALTFTVAKTNIGKAAARC